MPILYPRRLWSKERAAFPLESSVSIFCMKDASLSMGMISLHHLELWWHQQRVKLHKQHKMHKADTKWTTYRKQQMFLKQVKKSCWKSNTILSWTGICPLQPAELTSLFTLLNFPIKMIMWQTWLSKHCSNQKAATAFLIWNIAQRYHFKKADGISCLKNDCLLA